jgi:ribosomal protein L37AE/L43A
VSYVGIVLGLISRAGERRCRVARDMSLACEECGRDRVTLMKTDKSIFWICLRCYLDYHKEDVVIDEKTTG